MIVKMKFINISGPRDDIDRVTDLYLSRYEIQLESALSELKTVDNLRPFVELNPYRDVLAQATQFVGYLPNVDDVTPDDSLGLDDMFEVVRKACEDYEGLQAKKEKKKASIEIEDVVTTEFAGRTDNLFQGTSSETHKYQVDQNGNVIK